MPRPVLLFCLLLSGLATAESQSLGPAEIAGHGAPGLALRLIDRQQPDPAADPFAWWQVEQQRLALLREWRQWARGARRLAELPEDLPVELARQAAELRVRFLLEDDQGAEARRVLRELIWDDRLEPAEQELAQWRRLLIRSYLGDRRVADAEIAARRYQQDHPQPGAEWQSLWARLLLQAGRPAEALPLLRAAGLDAGDPLMLMADLRAGVREAEAVYQQAEAMAQKDATPPAERALFWLIAAEAARTQGSSARVARGLDAGFRQLERLRRLAEFYPVDGDVLWQAYEDHGERIGNSQRLLIGSDAAWLQAVDEAMPRYPVRARSLLATLASTTPSSATRDQALYRLATILADEEQGLRLLRVLFLGAGRFTDDRQIPEAVRYLLLDDALVRGDIALASRLMTTLPRPPAGADAFRWSLRRARVLIMGGEVERGSQALSDLLGGPAALSEPELDRIMQVIFDLQAVDAHAQALTLLAAVEAAPVSDSRRRELLFWRADSEQALGRPEQAAWLYLASARHPPGVPGDPWGQTARYNAAAALATAGLVDDARRIYSELLRLAEDANRQSVLRQKLQQLWLQPAAADNVAPEVR